MRVLERGQPGYPVGLEIIERPPEMLYVVGELPQAPSVGVVGTRRCTRYGRTLAISFGEAVAGAGWCLVSGLARGIDGAAHEGMVAAGGVGVAVLGSGVDVCYPPEHRRLRDDILELGGAVVSEYPPGTPPDRWRFPERNRLIAGLVDALVVVEAGVTGGALITARLGFEQGRKVFSVPGDVDRPSSEGCNRLIRDGAHPVLGAADLIEELTVVLGPPISRPRGEVGDVETIEGLAARWKVSISEALVRVGAMEARGEVAIEGDAVRPI